MISIVLFGALIAFTALLCWAILPVVGGWILDKVFSSKPNG